MRSLFGVSQETLLWVIGALVLVIVVVLGAARADS